jgi:hypothetical protein
MVRTLSEREVPDERRQELAPDIAQTDEHDPVRHTIMPKTLATATVDRLLHHAHVVLTEGAFYPARRGDRGEGGGAARLTITGDQLSVGVEITCPRRWSPAVRPGGSPAVP